MNHLWLCLGLLSWQILALPQHHLLLQRHLLLQHHLLLQRHLLRQLRPLRQAPLLLAQLVTWRPQMVVRSSRRRPCLHFRRCFHHRALLHSWAHYQACPWVALGAPLRWLRRLLTRQRQLPARPP